jgi:hypothetical protein
VTTSISKILNCRRSFILALCLCLANSFFCQDLTIQVRNKTGYKVDSLSVDGIFIGTLGNDSLSKPIPIHSFPSDVFLPSIYGMVNAKKTKSFPDMCGTHLNYITKGHFIYELLLVESDPDDYFVLKDK